jgi:MFS family permease
VNAASGRAVMQWFPASERGFALGVRQTAIPVGGLISALVLPALALRSAFVFLAALCVAGALFGAAVIRERKGSAEDDVLEARGLGATLRDHRLWLLCGVLAGVQVVAAAMRIGGGRWSDRLGSRIRPLRIVGVASAITLAVAVVLLSAPLPLLIASFVLAGGLAMSWNGLSFTAAAEIAGRARAGAALGMQQSALAAAGAIVPPAFAAIVAASSWRLGFALSAVFPLAGVALLRPLRS